MRHSSCLVWRFNPPIRLSGQLIYPGWAPSIRADDCPVLTLCSFVSFSSLSRFEMHNVFTTSLQTGDDDEGTDTDAPGKCGVNPLSSVTPEDCDPLLRGLPSIGYRIYNQRPQASIASPEVRESYLCVCLRAHGFRNSCHTKMRVE